MQENNRLINNNQLVENLKFLKTILEILIIYEVRKKDTTHNLIMGRLNLTKVAMQLLKLHS
jgi:hypothetical protein